MSIKDFIGETTEYDKKLTLEEKKPKSWLKSVNAFANGKGGVFFLVWQTMISWLDLRMYKLFLRKSVKL